MRVEWIAGRPGARTDVPGDGNCALGRLASVGHGGGIHTGADLVDRIASVAAFARTHRVVQMGSRGGAQRYRADGNCVADNWH